MADSVSHLCSINHSWENAQQAGGSMEVGAPAKADARESGCRELGADGRRRGRVSDTGARWRERVPEVGGR